MTTKKKKKEVILPAKVRKEISNKFYTAVNEQKAKVRSSNKKMRKMASLLKECSKEIKTLREDRIKSVEKRINLFESDMNDKIDRFLDYKLDSYMPKDSVELRAKIEVLEPLVESVKTLFADSSIKLDDKGVGVLAKAKSEIETLREQVDTEINNRMKLEESTEKLLSKVFLTENMKGLTSSQKERITLIFEGASYKEIKSKFKGVRDTILEGEFSKQKKRAKKGVKGISTPIKTRKKKTVTENSELEDAWGSLL